MSESIGTLFNEDHANGMWKLCGVMDRCFKRDHRASWFFVGVLAGPSETVDEENLPGLLDTELLLHDS